jgi:hypothetical protein
VGDGRVEVLGPVDADAAGVEARELHGRPVLDKLGQTGTRCAREMK